ncbi:DUF1345 domain-containing protein [Aminobacter sp. Piv2-1]|uniref:DUF1345 domain-containing protein n=1 Tax=Aminobacter sp. Piv2-1 TaxID=3031122 RepID=UPI00309A1877
MKPFGRHFVFKISAAIGLAALAVAWALDQPLAFAISANAFFIVYAALVLREMPALSADYLSRRAQETDEPVAIIFLVTVAIIGAAVGSLFMLINGREAAGAIPLAFSLLSLPLGWFTLHAMTALHYAHLYWKGDGSDETDSVPGHKPMGGLIFPETGQPCGWDFLYFSVVIGMTAQTADTNVSSTPMRRAVLVHSIVSFFFNTIIVAAAVNLVVSLAN